MPKFYFGFNNSNVLFGTFVVWIKLQTNRVKVMIDKYLSLTVTTYNQRYIRVISATSCSSYQSVISNNRIILDRERHLYITLCRSCANIEHSNIVSLWSLVMHTPSLEEPEREINYSMTNTI